MSEDETPADLVDQSQWRDLRLLLNTLDDEILGLYADARLEGWRSRFTGPLIWLGRRGAMTIRGLAVAMEVTHSAMSQTVTAMRKQGLVQTVAGDDARTRQVDLTERGRKILPFLEAEWRATEAALIELEEEIPYALSQVVRDIEEALARRSFRSRLDDHLEAQGRKDGS